jgi:hypothetical protein
MKKAVFGLISNEEQAQRIVDHLLSAGFTYGDISILSPDRTKERLTINERGEAIYEPPVVENDLKRGELYPEGGRKERVTPEGIRRGQLSTEKHTKAPEGGVTGAVAGGVLGGSLGLLAGIGALAIPGLGIFIAAGPILGALSGTSVGGGLGLIIGALIGAGIPEYEAKKYEAGLKSGNILLSVHINTDIEKKRAVDILKKDGARNISASSEKTRAAH